MTHQAVAVFAGVDVFRGYGGLLGRDLARAKGFENALLNVVSYFSARRRALHAHGVDETRPNQHASGVDDTLHSETAGSWGGSLLTSTSGSFFVSAKGIFDLPRKTPQITH